MSRRHGVYVAVLLLTVCVIIASNAMAESTAYLTSELGPIQLMQGGVLLVALILALVGLYRAGGPGKPGGPMALAVSFFVFFLAWREIEIDDHVSGIHAFSWKYLTESEMPLAVRLAWGIPSILLVIYVGYQVLKHRDAIWAECFSAWPGRLRLMLFGGVGLLAVSQLWDKGRSLGERFGITAFEHGTKDPLPEELLELAGEMVLLFFVIDYLLWRKQPEPAATPDQGS